MKTRRTYTIELLPHLERCGDWHDKPLKWIARFEDSIFTQKAHTKKEAIEWARIASRAVDFNDAFSKSMANFDRLQLQKTCCHLTGIKH